MTEPPSHQAGLAAITRAASQEAGGVPSALLGDYLNAVLDAAASGRRLTGAELAGYAAAGQRAAEAGIALRGLVDLYLSATWRLWRELPTAATPAGLAPAAALRAAGLAVLRAADDAVAAAAEGFEQARLSAARREGEQRRELFDDLLSGRGGPGDLIGRGERLGLRLAGPHQVLLAGPGSPGGGLPPPGLDLEAAVSEAAAPAPSLTGMRGGLLVVIVGVVSGAEAGRVAGALARVLSSAQPALAKLGGTAAPPAGRPRGTGWPGPPGQPWPWRITVGRAYSGPGGVVRSYEEAAEALDAAQRLGLPEPVASAADLLVYQVLLRDRPAITDLVAATLSPLSRARGGAGPLLATLAAYFARGGVATEAARDLHLSVRAVTYRLARVKELTGRDPARPADALVLQVAVIGARMLDWPATPLPDR
jgi:PucR C-terminal helix-turn-helix domain/GGDEF-like domain